ncbi:hypothetical protein SSBR45G_60590 [Bradyrhizobium sp. SSBR45G]|nr:hypothetical protein SSBR45G_60590 [Bradyrhizobium sp. SSBR45G]GLH88478.1 hypothetical protein SSBR45R_59390 [Bradyrhizobium sp. SSBR45R]
MIRHDNESIYVERVSLPGRSYGRTQEIDMLDQQAPTPIKEVDGEKPAAAWDEYATIVGHGLEASVEDQWSGYPKRISEHKIGRPMRLRCGGLRLRLIRPTI